MKNALVAGAVGAVTTNVLHELVRRGVPAAPRVDLLGMQALAKLVATRAKPPAGKALYAQTMTADLLSNSAYFSLIGLAPRARAVQTERSRACSPASAPSYYRDRSGLAKIRRGAPA